MEKRFDAVGVGYTALDYFCVVPHLPAENTKLEVRDFTIQGGGPTATAMVTMRRLGLSAAYAGKVGDDSLGARMIEDLRREDVDVSSVVVEPGATSQCAFIMVDARTAARTILWTRGSVSRLKAREVDLDLVRSARGLFIDDLEPEAALAAAKAARAAKIPVLIDAGSLREGVRELLPLCDYIIASEHFAEQISGGANLRAALETLNAFGPIASVVTLGEKGCAFLSGGERRRGSGIRREGGRYDGRRGRFPRRVSLRRSRGPGHDAGLRLRERRRRAQVPQARRPRRHSDSFRGARLPRARAARHRFSLKS